MEKIQSNKMAERYFYKVSKNIFSQYSSPSYSIVLLWYDFFTCYSSFRFMSQKITANFSIFLHIIYQNLSRNRTKNEFSFFNIRNFLEKFFWLNKKKYQILNLSATYVTISSWVIINYKLFLKIKLIKEQKFNNYSIDN
jgi:hypothetical protein